MKSQLQGEGEEFIVVSWCLCALVVAFVFESGLWYKCGTAMKGPRLLPLEEQALRTVRRFGMLQPGERVVVAVSGGADSVALLVCLQRLAARLQITVTAAHLHHGLRGREADADEAFVRGLCAQLDIELASESAPVRERARASKQNLEEAAREARYEFLRRTARQTGAAKIAVGHTLDDQAETVLLHFFRGSGAGGLSAIYPVVDGIIVRPLLETNRDDILRYLDSLAIRHREDSSNRDLRLRRNLLRHKWIPQLKRDFNPRLIETLAREADLARETSDFLETVSLDAYQRLRSPIRGGILLPIKDIGEMHPLMRKLVLRRALREVRGTLRGISSRHTESMVSLCLSGQSGQSAELPGGNLAVRRFKNLAILQSRPESGAPFQYVLKLPGRCCVAEAGLEIIGKNGDATLFSRLEPDHALESERENRIASPFFAVLDGDCLPEALVVRSRRPGDRYGGPGHRKVKKMLIDAKIDLPSRSTLPVVAAGNAIVWIPGFKPARCFAARPDSSRCVILEACKI